MLFFFLLFGSQAVVIAGLVFGWSPAVFVTAGVLMCVAAAYVFVTGMILVRRMITRVHRPCHRHGPGRPEHQHPHQRPGRLDGLAARPQDAAGRTAQDDRLDPFGHA